MATPCTGVGADAASADTMARISPSAARMRSRQRGAHDERPAGGLRRAAGRAPNAAPMRRVGGARRDGRPAKPTIGWTRAGPPTRVDGRGRAEEVRQQSKPVPVRFENEPRRITRVRHEERWLSLPPDGGFGAQAAGGDQVGCSMPPCCASPRASESGMIDVVRDKAAILPAGQWALDAGPPGSRCPSRTVAVVVFDGVSLFELGVACDIFGSRDMADVGVPWYELSVCGAGGVPVAPIAVFRCTYLSGWRASVVRPLSCRRPTISNRFPPRSSTCCVMRTNVAVASSRCAPGPSSSPRPGCSGADVPPRIGQSVTILPARYPDVSVDPGVLYVDEGDILTSAGSAASIDLCLHVVRLDYGAEVATLLARQLVVPPRARWRPSPVHRFAVASSGELQFVR